MGWILSQLINFLADLAESLINILIDLFSRGIGLQGNTTLASFFYLFPICKEAYGIFIWVGFFLLFTICVFQLFKSLMGPLSEAESPMLLVARTTFFCLLVGFSETICQYIINIATVPYQALSNMSPWDGVTGDLTMYSEATQGVTTLISGIAVYTSVVALGGLVMFLFAIFLFMLVKEFFKLLLEIVERYVILGVLTVVSPLCIACGASKATNQIFRSFIKLYISQVIVMCFSIFFLAGFTSGFAQWMKTLGGATFAFTFKGMSGTDVDLAGFFVQGLMLLAWLKIGQKIDAHMGQLGLNVAQAGGMADTFMHGMHEGMTNPRSVSGKAGAALANKVHGTTFGQAGSALNPFDALVSGKTSKQSKMLEAMQGPGGPKNNSNRSKSMQAAKGAVKSGTMNGKKASLNSAGMAKALGNKQISSGVPIGNGAADMLGLNIPEGFKPTENCWAGNNKMGLEFANSDGQTLSFSGDFNPASEDTKAQVPGKGDWAGQTFNVTGINSGGTFDMLNGDKRNLGPNLSAGSDELEAAQEATGMQEVNSPDMSPGANAQRWDEAGNPISMPERADFSEGTEGDNQFAQAMEDYDNSSIYAPDGNVYENGATMDGDSVVGNQIDADGASLVDADGQAFEGEVAKWDSDGNLVSMPEREDFPEGAEGDNPFAQAMEDYDSASMIAPDGNIYAADGVSVNGDEISGAQLGINDAASGVDSFGAIAEGSDVIQSDENGSIAMAANDSSVMERSAQGDVGMLSADGAAQAMVSDEKGDMAYDANSNSFIPAESAVDGNGTLKDGVAGHYEDSNGNTVSKADAVNADGSLKEGMSAKADTFSSLASNPEAMSSAASGIQLQKDSDNHIATFDGNGNAVSGGQGAFVKSADGKLMNASSFEQQTNHDGSSFVTGHQAAAISGGSMPLQTNSEGQIATFNGAGQETADGNYVKSESGQLMSKSSFAMNSAGNIQGFSQTSATSSSMNNLQTNTKTGQPESFSADGKVSSSGGFYKQNNADGSQSLVSKSSYSGVYQNPSSADTGGYVQTVDSSGKSTGYVAVANTVCGAPAAMMQQQSSSGAISYVPHDGSNAPVYTSVKDSQGNSTYAQVATSPSGNIATYQPAAGAVKCSISNIDGSAPTVSSAEYKSVGSSGGAYCKTADNSYQAIASSGYSSDGSMKTYDDVGGQYVENSSGQGSYAMVKNESSATGTSFARLQEGSNATTTYNQNQRTDSGFAVSGFDANNNATMDVSPQNFSYSYKGEGTYEGQINGQNYKMYDCSAYDGSAIQDVKGAAKLSFGNGTSVYAIPTNAENLRVQANDTLKNAYTGSAASDRLEKYNLSSSDYDTVVKTPQGEVAYNANAPIKYNASAKRYERDASFITEHKPEGKEQSYTTFTADNGQTIYNCPTKIHYTDNMGSQAHLMFSKQIRDENSNKISRLAPKRKNNFNTQKTTYTSKNQTFNMRH